jgi:hypothetical protein
MAQVNRANLANNLNLGSAWLGGGSGTGGQPGSVDIAAWGTPNTTVGNTQALGGAVSWQGILFQSAQTSNVTIGTTAAAITIGTSGIDLSASVANLTIASPVAVTLGANQTWSVASGRTLTMSGVTGAISGTAKNVSISGAGTTAFSGNSSASWTSSTLTVSGGLVTASDNRAFGASTNTVAVSGTGAVRISGANKTGPTTFTAEGQGSALQAGSIYFAGADLFATGKTITLQGASPTIGVDTREQNGVIAGPSITGDVTFNVFGTGPAAATFVNAGTFTVPNGNRIILQGINPATGVATLANFGIATSDTTSGGLGNATNKVTVKSTLGLTGASSNNATLARDYFFEGESSNATPTGQNTYSINPYGSSGSGWTFTGTITATTTPGYWVKASSTLSLAHFLQFGSSVGGKLDGSWSLRSFPSLQTVRFHPSLDISTWTGDVYGNKFDYGVAPVGAATWTANCTIDNIKGSALTLAHSGYTLSAGTVTFTGTDDLSTGPNNITTTGGTTFSTSTAGKRLTIPGNIAGSATLAKAGAGTLRLSGNNTGFSAFSHQAGVLELNSNGSAGPVGATFTFNATGTTIDSTTGATLTAAGTVNIGASTGGFTWNGTSNLTFPGTVTHGGSRTITFVNGATGVLTFSGPLSATTLTYLWNVGGGVAGAKNVLYIANTNASRATTGQVTAGYLRAGNAASLGDNTVPTLTTWTVSSGAAIELIGGITIPSNKSFAGLGAGAGPDTDGALRSVSGTNKWQGGISFAAATGARIRVDAGTFTLDPTGATAYIGIDGPVTPNTAPITFSAGSDAVLNQDRILAAGFSTVTIGNGPGMVVLSKANLHSGAMTCSAGTTKLTNVAAVGAGAGNSVTVTAGATMESAVKAIFPATLTLGSTSTPAIFKISA